MEGLQQTLKSSFWNIRGYKSRVVGNKSSDPDFLSEINESDLLGISETHIYDDILEKLAVAGFSRID